jgi:hypothetical protein
MKLLDSLSSQVQLRDVLLIFEKRDPAELFFLSVILRIISSLTVNLVTS